MPRAHTDSDLGMLKTLAEKLAKEHGQTATSAHLLAAIADTASAAADLLRERKLHPERLLEAAGGVTDDDAQSLRAMLDRARELAYRMGVPAATASHLLLVVVSQRQSAAYRTLTRCGVDVGRLRTAAMNSGLGLVARRRVVGAAEPPAAAARRAAAPQQQRKTAPRSRRPSGVAIPLISDETRRALPRRVKPAATMPPEPAKPPPEPAKPEPRPHARRPTAPEPAKKPRRAATGRDRKDDPIARHRLDPKKFPTLCALGTNLNLLAARGELDPVVGRDAEIEQTLDILAKRHGNNPCLVGVAGVGKTSVARGLAQRMAGAAARASLDDRIVIEIPVADLIAGTGVRGALAERIGTLRKEVDAAAGRVVLFFDEIHQLFSGDGADEIGAELKTALARGELPCVGTSTPDEYRRTIEADAALCRRFTRIEIEEPGREDAFLILDAVSEKLSLHHRVSYDMDALALSVNWAVRYLPGSALPDKAISVADLAGARTRRRGHAEVTIEAVAEVVSELADLPVDRLLETDNDRMMQLEHLLQGRIVGHQTQLLRIARILKRNAAGLGSQRPLGTFLLLGPTGVGKTETAKAVAEVLFHNADAMTRIDLSEYGEPHAVARLLGAPPGYVGHEAGGQLTEAVRRRPYQVLLLDEVEKAHPDVLVAFLPVFDEGRLTDGRGRTVNFTNTIILMTSNLGSDVSGASPKRRLGFGNDSGPDHADLERAVTSAARGALAPELYNRIDEVLVFAPLARAEMHQIARRLLSTVAVALEQQHGIEFHADDDAIEYLLDAGGFDPSLGARPMKRAIARLVEAPLAERILSGDLQRGHVALLTVLDGELEIDTLDGALASISA